jgi:oligoribonuclease NrnB/cAMP/cGMP phosphodiesterase (DHH superfamily)
MGKIKDFDIAFTNYIWDLDLNEEELDTLQNECFKHYGKYKTLDNFPLEVKE